MKTITAVAKNDKIIDIKDAAPAKKETFGTKKLSTVKGFVVKPMFVGTAVNGNMFAALTVKTVYGETKSFWNIRVFQPELIEFLTKHIQPVAKKITKDGAETDILSYPKVYIFGRDHKSESRVTKDGTTTVYNNTVIHALYAEVLDTDNHVWICSNGNTRNTGFTVEK